MSPPPINIGGITGKQAISLTASQLNTIIKPITSVVKSQASLAKSSTADFVKATGRGVVSGAKSFQTAAVGRGFDKEGMISTAFDDNPLMNMVGDMFGQGKKETAEEEERKREEEKKQIEQAHHDVSVQRLDSAVSAIEKMKDTLIVMKGLVDRIEMSVRDSNKIAEAEGKRAQRNASRKRMADIETAREAEDGGGDFIGPIQQAPTANAGGGGGIGGLLSSLGGMFSQIPGFGMISSLFSGGIAGIKTVFSKLFWPVTAILGIISFVDGFMKGMEEGGVGEGVTQGFENLIDNLIDVPLNMLKDLLAWALGALGFDEASTLVGDFEFDLSSIVRPIVDFFTGLWDTLMNIPKQIADFVKNQVADVPFIGGAVSAIGSWLGGDEEDEPSERGADGTDKRLKASESPAPAPRTSKTGTKKEAKPTPKSKAAEEKKLSDDEMLLQDVDPSTGVPKFMLKKYKDEYIEDEDERGRVGAMYKTKMNEQIGGGKIMWDKESKLYKQDKRTDAEADLDNRIEKFNEVTPEEREVWKTERDKKNLGYAEEQLGDATDPEVRAEILQYIKELKSDMGIKTADKLQDAGLEKGAAGAAPVVINSSPQTTVSNSNHPTSAVLAGSRDLSSDPSLNVNP